MRTIPAVPPQRSRLAPILFGVLCVTTTTLSAWDAHATAKNSTATARATMESCADADHVAGAITVLLREARLDIEALRKVANGGGPASAQATVALATLGVR